MQAVTKLLPCFSISYSQLQALATFVILQLDKGNTKFKISSKLLSVVYKLQIFFYAPLPLVFLVIFFPFWIKSANLHISFILVAFGTAF